MSPQNYIPQAYVGYNQNARIYCSYSGNLTKIKEAHIRVMMRNKGYTPGWKTKQVEIKKDGNLFSYKEDGAGGAVKLIEIIRA